MIVLVPLVLFPLWVLANLFALKAGQFWQDLDHFSPNNDCILLSLPRNYLSSNFVKLQNKEIYQTIL